MNDKTKGYILGVIAAAAYGMNPLFALPLYADGMDPDSVLLFRYVFAIILVGVMLKIRGRSFAIHGRDLPLLAIMGFLLALSSLTLFQSYNYMDAGIASVLLFVYPVMVALIMSLCFRERLTANTLFCLCMTILGIIMLYEGEEGTTLSVIGIILVFVSAFSYAVYIVGANKTRLKGMATLKVTFYVLLFGSLLFLFRLAAKGGMTMPQEWYHWLNLFLLALFPTAISFICTTKAVIYIGSTTTAILGALEPVTALFIGVVVFKEELTYKEFSGVMLIIIAVTLVIAGGSITGNMLRLRKMFPKLSLYRNKRNKF